MIAAHAVLAMTLAMTPATTPATTMAEVFGADGLVLVLFVIIGLGIPAWAIVDAISRPTGAFAAAGSSKGLWIALILGFWFITGVIGVVMAIVYLAVIRPRVMAVMR